MFKKKIINQNGFWIIKIVSNKNKINSLNKQMKFKENKKVKLILRKKLNNK